MELQLYNNQFQEIVNIIEAARERTYKKVNEELILMYQAIGKNISEQSQSAAYGDVLYRALRSFLNIIIPN